MILCLKSQGISSHDIDLAILKNIKTQHQKGWLIQSYVDQSHKLSCGELSKYIPPNHCQWNHQLTNFYEELF